MADDHLTILMVDDEEIILEAVSDLLVDMGHKVYTVTNGENAIKWIEKNTDVDLLIVDINMPNMNGRQLVAVVRKTLPNLNVIFTSGYHPAINNDLKDDSRTYFLRKPYEPTALENLIKEITRDPDASTLKQA